MKVSIKEEDDPICTIFPNNFILFCYKVINVLAAWPIFKRNCWVSIMNVMLDSSLLWWLCRAKRKTSKNRLQTRKSLFRNAEFHTYDKNHSFYKVKRREKKHIIRSNEHFPLYLSAINSSFPIFPPPLKLTNSNISI